MVAAGFRLRPYTRSNDTSLVSQSAKVITTGKDDVVFVWQARRNGEYLAFAAGVVVAGVGG